MKQHGQIEKNYSTPYRILKNSENGPWTPILSIVIDEIYLYKTPKLNFPTYFGKIPYAGLNQKSKTVS